MYSGEAEFQQCIESVQSQRGLEHFLHHVIRNKPEAEAHNALWSAWEQEKFRYDLFVKIDADTILKDPDSVARVWELFDTDKNVTGAQLRLHDYFTDDLIAGLNFFSPVVKFNTSPDLYCDRVDTNHNVVMKGGKVKHLEPIGYHCKNPSDIQSYHFGLHRTLKGQVPTLRKVWDAYMHHSDRPRMLALLGAHAAKMNSHEFAGLNNSYTSPHLQRSFAQSLEQAQDRSTSDAIIAELARSLGFVCDF